MPNIWMEYGNGIEKKKERGMEFVPLLFLMVNKVK